MSESDVLLRSSMEGGELFSRIQQRQTNPYTEGDAARYISMMVQAVARLHAMDIVSAFPLQHVRSTLIFLGSS